MTGPTTFVAKSDATLWLSTVEADIHRGDHLDPAGRSVTFGEFASRWRATKTSLRPRTQELYDYLLRVHVLPTFGNTPVARVDAAAVRAWNSEVRSGRISDTTAAKAYRLVRQIMQSAVDDRLIRENPCRVKGAATERSAEREIPTLDEVMCLADVIGSRYRAMVLVAAFVGLRKGECFGLARRHVDLEAVPPVVRVERARVDTAEFGMIFQEPKTIAGVRTVALPQVVAAELRSHLQHYVQDSPESLIFTAAHSGDTPRRSFGVEFGAKPDRPPVSAARSTIFVM